VAAQPRYSDLAIVTALTLRAVFRLALRQAEGLLGRHCHNNRLWRAARSWARIEE
jgi:Transposase DDE domain